MPKVLKAPKQTAEKVNGASDPTKLQKKLFHTIKIAKGAAKKARQFEIQRHIRKLKQAQNVESQAKSSSSPEELERDIELLKHVDTHNVATNALLSKLIKNKLLPKHQLDATPDEESVETYPLWPVAQELGIHASSSTCTKSEHAERILHQVQSNKAFAEELARCVQTLVALISPPRKAEASGKDERTKPVAASKPIDTSSTTEKSVAEDVSSDGYSSDDGFSDEENQRPKVQPQNWKNMDELDAMVGSGSDTSDSESGSESTAGDDRIGEESIGGRVESKKRARDESPDSDDDFLPSLATSFVPPTAADDWDDAEADFADQDADGKGPPKSMRKNRRGQRERRANANHLKLRAKEPRHSKLRDSIRLPKPDLPKESANAVPLATRSKPRSSLNPGAASRLNSKESPASAIPGKSDNLHPSWVAKQRAKEAQSAMRPVGKKIVFD